MGPDSGADEKQWEWRRGVVLTERDKKRIMA